MKLFLSFLVVALLTIVAGAPPVHAQGIPSIGSGFHIIPDANTLDATCPVGAPLSFGAIMHIIQNLLGAAIAFGVLIFVIMLAWGGFLLITSPVNAEAKSTARKLLGNAAIGLLITMSAWLIVDFVMKALYNPNNSGWGPWNSILGDGPACVKKTENMEALFSEAITANELKVLRGTGIDSDSGVVAGGGGCSPVPSSQLRTIDASASHGQTRRGTADTVQRFMRMRVAALEDGVNLKAGSAYRSPQEAEDLWRSRGCRVVNGRTQCNGALVAKPCSLGGAGSNHTKGTAIDIQTDRAGIAWLRSNAAQYGFYNRIPSEPWHWSDTGY